MKRYKERRSRGVGRHPKTTGDRKTSVQLLLVHPFLPVQEEVQKGIIRQNKWEHFMATQLLAQISSKDFLGCLLWVLRDDH